MQIMAVPTGLSVADIDSTKYQGAKGVEGTESFSFSEMLFSEMQGAGTAYANETVGEAPGYDDIEICMGHALWLEVGEGTKGEDENDGIGEALAPAEPERDESEEEQPMVSQGVPILFFHQPQEVSQPPESWTESPDIRPGHNAGENAVLPTAIAIEGAMDGAVTVLKPENDIHGTASQGYRDSLGLDKETADVHESPGDMELYGLSETENTKFMELLKDMEPQETEPNARQPADFVEVGRSLGQKWPLTENPVETFMTGEMKNHEGLPAATRRDEGLPAIRGYQRDQERGRIADQTILPLNSSFRFDEVTATVQGGESPKRAEPVATSVIEQIIDRVAFSKKEGRTELTVQLKPDSMGTVSVRLTSENGLTMAKIITDRPETKELLEGQLLALRQQLGDRGIDVKELDIVYAGTGFMQQHPDTGRERDGREPAIRHRFYNKQQRGTDEPPARIAPGEILVTGKINYLV